MGQRWGYPASPYRCRVTEDHHANCAHRSRDDRTCRPSACVAARCVRLAVTGAGSALLAACGGAASPTTAPAASPTAAAAAATDRKAHNRRHARCVSLDARRDEHASQPAATSAADCRADRRRANSRTGRQRASSAATDRARGDCRQRGQRGDDGTDGRQTARAEPERAGCLHEAANAVQVRQRAAAEERQGDDLSVLLQSRRRLRAATISTGRSWKSGSARRSTRPLCRTATTPKSSARPLQAVTSLISCLIDVRPAPDLNKYIQQGAFVDLTSYVTGDALKEYPNLARFPAQLWKNAAIKGKIWGVPRPRTFAGNPLIYRQDWAEKVGVPQVTNAADFLKAMTAMTKNDPDGNGKADTFGMSAQSGTALDFAFFQQMWRTPNEWRRNPDGTLTNAIETDESKAAVGFMRDLWAAGGFHPDAINMTVAQCKDNFAASKIGAYNDSFLHPAEQPRPRQQDLAARPRQDRQCDRAGAAGA